MKTQLILFLTLAAVLLGRPAIAQSPVDSYTLGEGDVIGIQVFDEPDLTMSATIGASGSINYSYLGDIQVAGKTAQELEQLLIELLRDGYLVSPSVNVSIEKFRLFYINGEVRSPGGYPYQPGLTLDKAIALAGGLTDRASRRKMFVMSAESTERTRATLSTRIAPGDIISINEGFF
ncbi:MAG: polysaccharide biosynthesis/export family protein [Granulosicoccus sp.]